MSDLNHTAERIDNLQEIRKNLDILPNIFDRKSSADNKYLTDSNSRSVM